MTGAELIIVLIAVVIGAIVKSITGMGLPLIAIPIASLFVPVDDAIVVIAFPNVLANAVLAGKERRSYAQTRDLPTLAVAGVIGAVIGALLLVNIPATPLVVAVIITIVGYIALFFARPDFRVTAERSKRLAPVVGGVGGVFQGAVGISGPIIGSWIHSYRLPRGAHILSVTSLFFITGLAQLAVLVATGALSGRVVATLLACIPVFASIPIGTRLRNSISGRGFDLAIIAMLGVSAIVLGLKTIF